MSSGPASSSAESDFSALSVSLVGIPQESGQAESIEAMSKPADAPKASASSSKDSPGTGNSVLDLIEAMSAAPSRRDAAVVLIGYLALQCSGCTVRCGLGRDRLTHLFDSRLGWLGSESSLHQQHSEQWDTPRQNADDPPPNVASVFRRGQAIELWFPQPGGSGQCFVWIEGTEVETKTLAWTPLTLSTLGSVLWNRPIRSWPSLVVRMGKQTSYLILVASVVLLTLALWPVHYRVASTARVETTSQRLVSTPFEATLLKANVKPGDTVQQGDVLLVLDGRPLRLERESIEAEIQQISKTHDVALATGRIADAQQAAFKEQHLRRQFDLLSDRLGRLEVISPIDGIVVSGDLEKFVGSPLERGQTLIEVAPMDTMVIEIEIPEHEIGYVQKGAATRVKIDAIGGKSIRLPLSEVYPSAEVREDRNVFIGRIELENADRKLKPGMRGEATTYGPRRPWIWSWVRGGIERVLWWIGY